MERPWDEECRLLGKMARIVIGIKIVMGTVVVKHVNVVKLMDPVSLNSIWGRGVKSCVSEIYSEGFRGQCSP